MKIALVNNNTIVNIILVDSIDTQFLESIKEEQNFTSYFSEEDYTYPFSVNWILDTEDSLWKPQNKIFSSWVFDKDLGSYVAPVPHPAASEDPSKYWAWDEASINWILSDTPAG